LKYRNLFNRRFILLRRAGVYSTIMHRLIVREQLEGIARSTWWCSRKFMVESNVNTTAIKIV